MTVCGVIAFPFVATAMFVVGITCAVAHVAALPGLYLWEWYLERNPSLPEPSGGPESCKPGQEVPHPRSEERSALES